MSTSDDQELRAQFHRYAQAALSALREANKGGRAFVYGQAAAYEGNRMQSGHERRLDAYRALKAMDSERLERLPEMGPVAERMPDTPQHNRFYGSRENRARRVVEYYVYHRETLRYSAAHFQSDLDAHLKMWASHRFAVVLRAPLVGVSLGAGRTTLGQGVRVAPFTDEQRRNFAKILDVHSSKRPIDLISSRYLLETSVSVDCAKLAGDNIRINLQDHRESMADAVTALRLSGVTGMGVLGVQERWMPSPRSDLFYTPNSALNPGGELETSGFTGECVLEKRALAAARQTLSALASLRSSQTYAQLALGLHWFNQAFSAPRAEDKILALAVALESSILRELRGDLTYRLRLRGLCLTKPKPEAATAAGVALSTLYRCRSEIAHQGIPLASALERVYRGKQPLPSEQEFLRDSCRLVGILLSRCVAELASGKRLDELLRELDRRIDEGAACS